MRLPVGEEREDAFVVRHRVHRSMAHTLYPTHDATWAKAHHALPRPAEETISANCDRAHTTSSEEKVVRQIVAARASPRFVWSALTRAPVRTPTATKGRVREATKS
jgi:hypothetical protein